jgi:hypothetical protein
VEKTIRAAQFMYFVPTGETYRDKTGEEQELLSVRHAFFGDTVDIPRAEDVESGEKGGAFVTEDEEEVEQDSPVAADEETDLFSHDSLVLWIKNTKPSAVKVVEAAEDNPDKAEALLKAENEATGGQPRKAVVRGLEEILEEDEEDEE